MKVSSKEHKETRLERIEKLISEKILHRPTAADLAKAVIAAYPDPPMEKDKDTKAPIPKDNDGIVLCMLRVEAQLLAEALDQLPSGYQRVKALATALREQKVVR